MKNIMSICLPLLFCVLLCSTSANANCYKPVKKFVPARKTTYYVIKYSFTFSGQNDPFLTVEIPFQDETTQHPGTPIIGGNGNGYLINTSNYPNYASFDVRVGGPFSNQADIRIRNCFNGNGTTAYINNLVQLPSCINVLTPNSGSVGCEAR